MGPLFGPFRVGGDAPGPGKGRAGAGLFPTERSVAGNGAYLISFLPQNEVKRVVRYAAAQGHSKFAAMLPQTPYGDVAEGAFKDSVAAAGGQAVDMERFTPNAGAVMEPAAAVAKTDADALLIAQGGTVLKAIGPALIFNNLDRTKVKLLGTGLWADASLWREDSLTGGWFAAPEPDADTAFVGKYPRRVQFEPGHPGQPCL